MVAQRPEKEGVKDFNTLHFFTSKDLKKWKLEGEIAGFHECPDLFRVPVKEDRSEKWILSCGNGSYRIGDFDGHVFIPDPMQENRLDYFPDAPFPDMYYMVYGNHTWADPNRGIASHRGQAYAFQAFQDAPEGRCIRIGWMFVYFSAVGEIFSQCLTIPQELALQHTGVGVRLCAQPVKEIQELYLDHLHDRYSIHAEGKALDCMIDMDISQTAQVGQYSFRYVKEEKYLEITPIGCPSFKLPFIPLQNKIRIRSVWDVGTVEFYIGEGEVYLPLATGDYKLDGLNIQISGEGVSTIDVYTLRRAIHNN